MSKVLIVSDIHINDYKQRNPSNLYRLHQGSRIVAENIIKVGKQEGCDYVMFAGDVIEKSVLRPYVMAEVKYFLDTVMAEFKEGALIYGNHCMDNKSNSQDMTDSLLGLILPENLHYMHQKTLKIDNTTFAFSNWQPEFDLSWISSPVDVLVTHAKICYSPDVDGLIESQKLDESKFSLAICGDIHRMAQLGKYVSIGIPQRCKMGDSDLSSGVVFDCSSKKWGWVNLNPDDNLMKFEYVPELEREGWDERTKTWYVYKQDSSIVDESGKIKVDAWEEINTLIEDAIVKSNLQAVHNEVLTNITNIDSGEVDFNFTLLHLHCENWRSIESADIDFRCGDKILIQGSNGSGKSSLLSAIQYAFIDCGDTQGLSSLKSFTQFGKKNCMTSVEFLYQGNKCKIQRGTNTYGLWINDEPQKYSDKRSFEADCRDRFPFIKYMDAFVFGPERMSFLKSLSPERITDITSKFLKLNRLDTYNNTAKTLYEQVKFEYTEVLAKVKETEKLLGYISEKMASVTVPTESLQTLEQLKASGLELQRKNNLWNQFVNSTTRLQAMIQSSESRITELNLEKQGFRDEALIRSEIDEINKQIKILQDSLVELGNIRINLDFKTKEYNKLREEGNQAWREAQNIGLGKKCSLCGQSISTTEAMEAHKQELLQKVEQLRPQIQQLQIEIEELTKTCNNSAAEYNRVSGQITNLNSEISVRMSEISHQTSVNSELTRVMGTWTTAKKELDSLGVVEKVDLPENFMYQMSNIESSIAAWKIYESTERDRILREQEQTQYKTQLNNIYLILQQLEQYLKLTGPTGVIFEEIFNKLAERFTNNMVMYSVERRGKGAREHLSLVPYYNNNGNWTSIVMCSSGQRIMLDLDYLGRLMSSSPNGLIILDEFLKALDPDHLEEAIEMIKGMNVGCVLLTSHAESIPAFYNRCCFTSLNEGSGTTEIIVK